MEVGSLTLGLFIIRFEMLLLLVSLGGYMESKGS